jgi:hypothetical protein
MMTVQITCPNCQSSVEVYPDLEASKAKCDVCSEVIPVHFNQDHVEGQLKDCPVCQRKDFFMQKDFKRAFGVTLFLVASVLSIWTYGLSFIVLYGLDFFLFRKLRYVAVCYKCNTIFRGAENMDSIPEFNHEMHDRIVYSDHDFKGVPLDH